MKASVAIVDDHILMASALAGMIERFEDYQVLFDVHSGSALMTKLNAGDQPDIILLDVNMPIMDGYQTAQWLSENHPQIKVLALSMNDKDEAIIKMLRCGAKGYLLKGSRPSELKQALDAICEQGYFYTDYVTKKLIQKLNGESQKTRLEKLGLNEREVTFINLACSDLTYVEIADKMCLSPRTIDGYRESVFQKMDVKSRVGMVLEAIRLGLVILS